MIIANFRDVGTVCKCGWCGGLYVLHPVLIPDCDVSPYQPKQTDSHCIHCAIRLHDAEKQRALQP